MTLLAIDYESFYDKKNGYSLTTMGMEEYILDKRFSCHGAAVSVDGAKSEWLTHRELIRFFAGIDWSDVVFIAHNAKFDAAITIWRYKVPLPKLFVDTMGIANCFVRPHTGYVSLDACARYERLPLKSGVLPKVDGMNVEQIIAAGLWSAYASYACQDNDNALKIFFKYFPRMLPSERYKLSWTVENYVRSRLMLDSDLLQQALNMAEKDRADALAVAGLTDAAILRSPAKFANYLESLGIEVKYKNGKNDADIPAVAKKDPWVQELLQHPDPVVSNAMKARLAWSSSITVTRCKRLLRMAKMTGGRMLIPMNYHAAHTGRPGGSDGVNVTNFRKPQKGERELIREAIHCPPGMAMVDIDASQIEARLCSWLAGCKPLMEAFADPNRDAYCDYGTNVLYRRPITKADEKERQICKVEVLSLQYGVGHITLWKRLQAERIHITMAEAEQHVYAYRGAYPEILENGREFCDRLIWCLTKLKELSYKGFWVTPLGIQLPSKHWLYYPNLLRDGRELTYWSPRYKTRQKLYPGSMNENLCQAMANAIVGEVLVKYRRDAVLTIYDSVTRLVPLNQAQRVTDETVAAMSVTPSWAATVSKEPLVLRAEAKIRHHL